MSAFDYRNGRLHVEDVSLAAIAADVGTPFYCYSATALGERYDRLARTVAPSGASIAYAVKANGNLAVVELLGRLGAGADVVSEGEIRRALAAGVPAGRIVFSGVGKSREELAFAIGKGLHQINIESAAELDRIAAVSEALGATAAVAFRVNPDVSAGGHDKIDTGRRTDKFGLPPDEAIRLYHAAAGLSRVVPVGLAVHIGSQVRDVEIFAKAYGCLLDLSARLRSEGLDVSRLDLGGGLGVAYRDGERELPLDAYAGLLADVARRSGARLTIEPGRWLVADAGVLVATVNTVKQAGERRIAIVDAAMNDLIRPTLYDAHHPVWPVDRNEAAPRHPSTVAGPVCESGDILAVDAPLPDLGAGDLVAIGKAGAYGAAMSSGYNGRLLAPEVLVRGGEKAVVRRRPSHDEAMALESLPRWSSAADAA